jgi:hypothetical protein
METGTHATNHEDATDAEDTCEGIRRVSTGNRAKNGPQKPATARQRASKTTANRFDDVAKAAAAGASTADLTAQLQQSLDRTKAARPKATPKATTAKPKATGNGAKSTAKQPAAKATAKATTAKPKPTRPPHVDVEHPWSGPVPKGIPELKGASLIVRYELRPNGEVWWSRRASWCHSTSAVGALLCDL